MGCEKLSVLYFSPNGTTKKAACAAAAGTGLPVSEYDMTPFEARWQTIPLQQQEAVILAMPVYGGRLPGICREFFRGIKANGNPAAVLVTYGNNTCGEALAELKNRAAEAGFRVIAAAAIPSQHCLNAEMAAGRPNEKDLADLERFGARVGRLLEDPDKVGEVCLQGAYPYNYKIHDVRVTPVTGEGCARCGKCARECPVAAINPRELQETDATRCLLCMRCVNQCPTGARTLQDAKIAASMAFLRRMNPTEKEQSCFFGEAKR